MIRTIAMVMAGVLTAGVAEGRVIRVDEGATGAGDGSSWTDAFADLQDALLAVLPGDEIWVAAGTYRPSTTDATVSFTLKNGVGLYGGFAGTESAREQRDWAANVTVLSGDVGADDVFNGIYWIQGGFNSGHVVDGQGTDATAVLDGFTVSQGALGPEGTSAGSPLMVGSGVYLYEGSATLRNCRFLSNRGAFASGGAVSIYNGNPEITGCRFEYNSVHLANGGGIYSGGDSSPVVRDCVFLSNTVTFSSDFEALGAGMYHQGSQPVTVEGCRFENNRVNPFNSVGGIAYGGGLAVFLGGGTVSGCTFIGNRAGLGGGMIAWGPTLVVNCVFVRNEAVAQPNDPYPERGGWGGGFMSYSFQPDVMRLVNCTFVGNTAKKYGAVCGGWNSTASIENSILWNNTGSHPEVAGYWHEELGGNFDLTRSDIELITGPPAAGEDILDPGALNGSFEADPLFVDAGGDDLRLAAGSPCIDAGDNSVVPAGVTTDALGAARFSDDPATADTGIGPAPVVDLGAFEFGPSSVPGDLDGDGAVGGADLAALLAAWGSPGATDLTGDGTTDGSDLAVLLAAWGTGGSR